MNSPRELLREQIFRLGLRESQGDLEGLLRELKGALLAFGSETEDNVTAIGSLALVGRRDAHVLGVAGANVALADLVNALEDLSVPDELRERFPKLDQTSWEAGLRVITLVLLALSPEP